jgi:multiple sugar transport system substrate-binding protein
MLFFYPILPRQESYPLFLSLNQYQIFLMSLKNNYHTTIYSILLSFLILLVWSCQTKPTIELTFAAGPDDSGAIQHLIDQFNTENQGHIKVNWKTTSRITDEYFKELQADFETEKPQIDVFAADVIWTGPLSAQQSIEDLSKTFYNHYPPNTFTQPALNAAIYNFRVYGVPWFTDAALIYYRKDLLNKSGLEQAPSTWAELKSMVLTVQENADIPYGYVFQGDNYEGGVTNACEFIWNAGGEIILDNSALIAGQDENSPESNIITIDSRASESGFGMALSLIEEGFSPKEVVNYREKEVEESFLNGQAIFMRGWPGTYGRFLEEGAKIKANQVGICPIPVIEIDKPAYSCLGGWNLMIAAHTSEAKKEAAWKFIQYLTATEQQRYRAMKNGTLPTLKALYQDEELLAKVPVISLAKQRVNNAKSRPVSAHYMQYSPQIAMVFHQMLKGEIMPEYAVFSLQKYLEDIQLKDMVAEQ